MTIRYTALGNMLSVDEKNPMKRVDGTPSSVKLHLTMELYSKRLKPSSWIASHVKVLPSADGVTGCEEEQIHRIINSKQNHRKHFSVKMQCNIYNKNFILKISLGWGEKKKEIKLGVKQSLLGQRQYHVMERAVNLLPGDVGLRSRSDIWTSYLRLNVLIFSMGTTMFNLIFLLL